MSSDKGVSPNPPPVRIGRLDTADGIHREMARVYRDSRRGIITSAEGAKLSFQLMGMLKAIEVKIEVRLAALEQAAGLKKPAAVPRRLDA